MDNKKKVLRILFENPTYYFHLRELARKGKVHPNSLIKITDELKSEGIVTKNKKKHLIEIKLNLENEKTIFVKKIENLKGVFDSGLLTYLKEKYSPSSITLIGSYSRGEDIEKSDIDIVISSETKKQFDLDRFEKKLKRKIHILIPSKKDITREFFNNLINGVTLYGGIKNEAI